MSFLGDNTLPLISAFNFGLLLNAASAAIFLYCSGHGRKIFRDGPRLVLVTFLLSAALWAQAALFSTLLSTTATMPCQITVIFATIFDQLGRFALEQFLLWSINSGSKAGAAQIVLQVLLVGRFILGAVFVGLSRPSFDPVCIPIPYVVPVAAAVLAVDAIVILALAARASSAGLVRQIREKKPGAARSKAILAVIVGFLLWTLTSISMLLGTPVQNLILRSALPAFGLLILVVIVTAFNGSLAMTPARTPRPPESPGAIISRDISSSGSNGFPPSRYEDLKAEQNGVTMFAQPRQAPRPGGALPSISLPVTGGNGVGGLPVQGQLFPAPRPIVAAPAIVAAPVIAQQRSATGLRKPGSTGKLVISNPIIDESNREFNPLAKIPTIDLQTAAQMDRQRRNTDLALIAQRPAPKPPVMPIEEQIRRSASVKRKEVASVASVISMKAQAGPVSDTLEPQPIAITTATQLSPGFEELRRRSPRQPPPAPVQVEENIALTPPPKSPLRAKSRILSPATPEWEERTRSVQAIARPVEQMPPVPPVPQAITPPKTPAATTPKTPAPKTPMTPSQRQLARKTSVPTVPQIRPSRQLPTSPKTPPPEPTKTPLQRRPTIGLPGNPRAAAVKTPGADKTQTIMFVNNIVYNDPQIVQSVIKGAMPKTTEPESANSVLNRPRPIPRTSEKNLYPGAGAASPRTPSHRRTKSGGSVVSRKSILQSQPGSPTQLPPLPPPPKSAGSGAGQRPAPNSSKSMTFDEKMVMFFPGQSSGGNAPKRRSSVPELPAVPAQFAPVADVSDQAKALQSRMSRSTSRSTKRSTQHTESIFDADEILRTPDRKISVVAISALDDVGNSWIPGMAPDNRTTQSTTAWKDSTAKRASSPVLGAARYSNITSSTEDRTNDDTMTNWGSVHSPAAAVQIQWGQIPQETYINRQDQASALERPSYLQANQPIGERETMTFMLDTSQDHEREACTAAVMSKLESSPPQTQWHRRVGDKTLSFSGRKEMAGSRKMPPPRALVLGPPSTKNPVIIKAAELSPQESPGHALRAIQSQLKKMEEPNMAAFESPSQRRTRMTLLDNLEKEMDIQAGQWRLQHDNRDSTSTLMTSTTLDLDSRPQSMMSTKDTPSAADRLSIADRRASRRSRILSGSSASKSSSGSTASIQSSWQRRLAEAQSEYMDNAEQLRALRNTSTNFLNMSMAQLGSPTPPDSNDSDMEFELERSKSIAALSALTYIPQAAPAKKAPAATPSKHLWVPAPQVPAPSSVWLWSVQSAAPKRSVVDVELPGLAVRPAQRKESTPMTIQSSSLWRMPTTTKPVSGDRGLWQPSHPRPQSTVSASVSKPTAEPTRPVSSQLNDPSKKPRPVTVRPPRRNRRVTLLPDIVEDPQPLPDKRDTLGIFQFPWGEKSDTATVQPRNTMMAMPGTMSSGGQMALNAILQARARQLEADEYSSSFFDDYDDDEEYIDSDDDEDEEEDDDEDDGDDAFDETTLWEIASLLKTENVPSKNSLLPPALPGSIVDDYLGESSEQGNSEEAEIPITIEETTRPLALLNSNTEQPKTPKLWGLPKNPKQNKKSVGLPQPDSQTWKQYAGPRETLRSKPRPSEPSVIASTALWGTETAQEIPVEKEMASDLWVPGAVVEAPRRSRFMEKGTHGAGVGQPGKAVWERYDTEQKTARSKPRLEVDAGFIISEDLWVASPESMHAPSSAMWAAANVKAAPKHESKPAEGIVLAKITTPMQTVLVPCEVTLEAFTQRQTSLWTAPATLSPSVESKGLFSMERKRGDTRTTMEEPAAINMERKARSSEPSLPLDKLTSTSLWTAPATLPPSAENNGLFYIKPKHTDIRTTTKQPAAIHTEQKARSPKPSLPLAKPTPTSLWTAPAVLPPSVENNGLFRIEPKRADTRTTTEEPAAVNMERKARSPEPSLPLDDLTSTSLWSPTPAADDEAGWMTFLVRPKELGNTWWEQAATDGAASPPRVRASRPDLLRCPRPSDAVPRNWDAELAEAITASYPRIPRPTIVMDEWWECELGAAIRASYPRIPRPNATEEMWETALAEALELSHPFDVSRFHPVFAFFGDLSLTCDIASVHPAIAQYVAAPEEEGDMFDFEDDAAAPRGVDEDQSNIMAQIAALEAEREFAERAMRDGSFAFEQSNASMPALSSGGETDEEEDYDEPLVPAIPAMWSSNVGASKAEETEEGMWAPSSLPPVPRVPSMLIAEQEDAEAEALRRSRRTMSRAADQIPLVQTDIESGEMWNKEKWARQERGKSIVGARGWLGEEDARRKSQGVVLRYD